MLKTLQRRMLVRLPRQPLASRQVHSSEYKNDWRASALMGATVSNERGQRVATIRDLLITAEGRIDKVVLTVTRRRKVIAVAFAQLQILPSQQFYTPVRAVRGRTSRMVSHAERRPYGLMASGRDTQVTCTNGRFRSYALAAPLAVATPLTIFRYPELAKGSAETEQTKLQTGGAQATSAASEAPQRVIRNSGGRTFVQGSRKNRHPRLMPPVLSYQLLWRLPTVETLCAMMAVTKPFAD